MSDKKEKIIEKIRKLMLHERSARAIGNIAEADAFAEQVEKLRAKHNITGAIELDSEDTYGAESVFEPDSKMFKRKRIFWEEQLFTPICYFFDCQAMFFKRTNLKVVIGEKENRRKVIETYLELFDAVETATAQFLDNFSKILHFDTRSWKQSFLLGFAKGIEQRLQQLKAAREFVRAKNAAASEPVPARPDNTEIKYERAAIAPPSSGETAIALSNKPVHRAPSEKQKRIEKILENIGTATTKISEVEEIPYVNGVAKALNCILPGELALPEQNVRRDLEELQKEDEGKRSSIYSPFGNGNRFIYFSAEFF